VEVHVDGVVVKKVFILFVLLSFYCFSEVSQVRMELV
jgi:hypothetical protein